MSPLPEIAFALCRNPAVAVGLPMALGVAGSYITAEIRSKRTGVASPVICKPHPAFSYIWYAMYGLAGYAAHLTVDAFDRAPTPQMTEDASNALILYYAQLGLNLLWEPLFVGENAQKGALATMVGLLGTALTMTVKMNDLDLKPVNTTWFLAPYCAWLGYTTYLNVRTVYDNEKKTA